MHPRFAFSKTVAVNLDLVNFVAPDGTTDRRRVQRRRAAAAPGAGRIPLAPARRGPPRSAAPFLKTSKGLLRETSIALANHAADGSLHVGLTRNAVDFTGEEAAQIYRHLTRHGDKLD